MASLFKNATSVFMADDPEAGGGGGNGTGENEITPESKDLSIDGAGVDRLIELVNDLLPEGVFLPEGTTGEDLVHNMEVIVATIIGIDGGSQTPVVEAPTDVPMAQLSNEMVKQKAPAWAVTLANAVSTIAVSNTNTLRSQFEARVAELGRAGVPAKVLAAKTKLGAKYGYDMELLDGLGASVAMSNQAQRLGHTGAPDIHAGRKGNRPTEADCKSIAGRILAKRGVRRNAQKES